jgi:MFS family permease
MPHDGTSTAVPPGTAARGQPVDDSETDAKPASAARGLSGWALTFRSLRHRNYRLYFFGQLVSLTGTWMQQAALTWLAYELTHLSKWPALIATAQILPTFVFGLWGGALADRWPKRSLIFATQAAFLLLALLLAGLVYTGVVQPWQLLVVAVLNGLVQAVDLPARLAFVMDMAGREDLMNAVALNSLLFNSARALGPAVGGLLLLWFRPWACFLANAISYVAVLWALAEMDISGFARTVASDKGFRALLDGFRYLARHRELGFLVLLNGSTALFGWACLPVLPALAQNHLGAASVGYSLMVSGIGVGALIAALTLATIGSMEHRRAFIGAGVAIVCTALVALALANFLTLSFVFCALLGFGLILLLATSQSVIQLGSAEHNRGRVMAIWAMTLSAAVPLGNLIAGPAADAWGEPLVVAMLGAACAVSGLALLTCFRLLSVQVTGR